MRGNDEKISPLFIEINISRVGESRLSFALPGDWIDPDAVSRSFFE
jgi:hypothetical protein